MDAEGRIIPIVEDDQGEGFTEILDVPPSTFDKLLKKSYWNPDPTMEEHICNQLAEIHDKLEAIMNKLNFIFGENTILFDGKLITIK